MIKDYLLEEMILSFVLYSSEENSQSFSRGVDTFMKE